ncbi:MULTISPECIES: membrane-bound PQQ-dependent dehydrogenase, glucose/quinate/shikimate family [Lysobacter]|jgi:quinoprotein glucose dehydrogenase|uniref:membrane-bound PQQ-dependent dehydrogenase, glucose/quinate/shikimate family n=1 Tax=Lysobacter TaxID=68 RepID=UPI001F3D8747|nr:MULTISPECIES: membrane-bound PQQ-dependent dehydrogenase, glucose/quinate/shikimate family [Lysobacter]UJB18749.1 membrane-bound PQQ-dependent dehydrogenase, glucose/quinate/shikimate family [Lysobacter capsici]UJQ27526.1 membrane-bound PQQ-dependent dehydrogenase, glucose/quinate/shikimate family [Lysobacter gummosus]
MPLKLDILINNPWPMRLVSAVVFLLGLALFGGGVYLAVLGGSWYYLLTGLALMVSGGQLFRDRRDGVWLFGGVFVATIVWTIWESGSSYWGWVPRLGLLTGLGMVIALLLPRLGFTRKQSWAATGVMAAIFAVAFVFAFVPYHVTSPTAAIPDRPLAKATRPAPASGDWIAYGRDKEATRYSPLAQLTAANVGQLKRVWTYRTGDLPPTGKVNKWGAQTTPLKIGNGLYLCTATNNLMRLDPATGKEVWRFDAGVKYTSVPYTAACRGVSYYESNQVAEGAVCKRRIIEATLDMRLIAVDTETGKLCPDFGNNGQTDMMVGFGKVVPGFVATTSPPPIVNGVVVVNHQVLDGQRRWAPSGVIRGYSAETGRFVWAWDVKRPYDRNEPPPGKTYSPGTPNSWGAMIGDDALGLVYVPTGNSAADYYSALRSPEENRVSSAVVALDAATGEQRWVFQTVHKDVWDYDIGSQPTLMDYPGEDGQAVPAIIVSTKRGQTFVLDRRSGTPLTPVEERPAPAAVLQGDPRAPTQPWSVGMPRLGFPDLTEQRMWGMTPLDQLYCRILFRKARYEGEFTAPSMSRPWIEYPGYNGGTDWGSMAFDPQTGILVGNWNNTPMYNQLLSRDQADARGLKAIDDPEYKPGGGGAEGPGAMAQTPYGVDVHPFMVKFTNILCNEPPYGMITAIDMHTRKVLWQRPLGTARANGPFGLPTYMPIEVGTPNNGGPIITAGGLVFVAAATDGLIRAIDMKTGKVVWSDVLPAGGQATPMTYEVGGRQYLVMMAGGHHFMQTPVGDYVVAYALPDASGQSAQ